MRIPRSEQLSAKSGLVHTYWKCHNSSFYLQHKAFKVLYLRHVLRALKHKNCEGKLSLRSFCVMDNHVHLILSYSEGSNSLSEFMRIAHSNFGRVFNKIRKRSGKVANERPKTSLLQNDESSQFKHAMRAHFYIEANPLMARKVKTQEDLRKIAHNSYAFFAYGEINEFSEHLEFPEWYLKLGNSNEERQKAYREHFSQYLNEFGLVSKKSKKVFYKKSMFSMLLKAEKKFQRSVFVGEDRWKKEHLNYLRRVGSQFNILIT